MKFLWSSYRWYTSSSVVQLVPLCFQVLTEGLLQCWSHFGHRPASPCTFTKSRDKNRRRKNIRHDLPRGTLHLRWTPKLKNIKWLRVQPSFPLNSATGPHCYSASFHPLLRAPSYKWTSCWGLHILYLALRAGAGSRVEWSRNSSGFPLYLQALYRRLCQPLNQEVSRHDVITFTTILGGKTSNQGVFMSFLGSVH